MGLKLSKILSEALDDDRAPHVKHLPTTSKLSKPASAVDDGDLHSTSENDKESSLQPLASAGAEALQPAKLPPSGDAEEDDHATEAVQSSEQVDMIKTSSQSSGNQCECGTEEYLMTTSTAASSDAAALRSIGATEATISLSTSNVLVRITLDALQRLLFGHDNSDNHVNSVLESVTPSPQDFFRLLQSLGANEELLQGLATAKIEALKLLILIHAGASKYSEISEIPHKSSSEHSTVGRTPSALGDSVGPGEEKIEETPSTAIPLPVCTPKPLEVLKSEHAASQLTAPPNISEAATLLLQQVVELKGDQDAVLQLCKCESVSCRAAYVISAIAMRSFVKLTTDTNLLQVQADRAQKAYTKAQSDLDGRLDELLETSKIALNYQQERDKALAAFKVLDEQLADPQSSQYLKFKVRRLEKENVEIPRLRERVAGVQGEHNELVRLPRTNATLQELVDTAQETSDDYAQFQIAHENMKRELNSLKKSTDATEALEVKNKLNQARSTNEELLATNKKLQEELEAHSLPLMLVPTTLSSKTMTTMPPLLRPCLRKTITWVSPNSNSPAKHSIPKPFVPSTISTSSTAQSSSEQPWSAAIRPVWAGTHSGDLSS